MQTPVHLLLASCALLLVGCGDKPTDLIVGNWESIVGGVWTGEPSGVRSAA